MEVTTPNSLVWILPASEADLKSSTYYTVREESHRLSLKSKQNN